MKLDVSDSQSNHSDFSCDSQSSQGSSTNDFTPAVSTSRSLTLTVSDLWRLLKWRHPDIYSIGFDKYKIEKFTVCTPM